MIKNAQDMNQVDNNLSGSNPYFAELSDHVVLTTGYDKPRYANIKDSKAGYLGWDAWADYWNKATGATAAVISTHAQDEAWYSCKVVPIDSDKSWRGVLDEGNPTTASQPVQGSVKYTSATGAYINVTTGAGTTTRFTLSSGTFDTSIIAGCLIKTTGFTDANYSGVAVSAVDGSSTWIEYDSGTAPTTDTSVAAATLTAALTIRWTIPIHAQRRTLGHTGTATTVAETSDTVITDSAASFGGDELVGVTVENVETGLTYTIASNTATTFTITGETSIFATDARYRVIEYECQKRRIYISKSTTAEGAISAVFYYNGIVEDNSTTTFDQSSYVTTTSIAPSEKFAPPYARFCHTAFNSIWMGGGIKDTTGTASYIEGILQGEAASYSTPSLVMDSGLISADDEFNGYTIRNMTNGNTDVVLDTVLSTNTLVLTTGGAAWAAVDDDIVIYESRTSTASANEGIAVSKTDETYSGSGDVVVARYTLGSALTDWSKIYVGSYVTITGSNESGNDVSNLRVLRVGTKWFEVYNNDMVAETDTGGMKVEVVINVYEGASSNMTEGMVGGNIILDGDSNYTISWVDTINQRIGVATMHAVPLELLTGKTIELITRNSLYKSDAYSPKVFSSTNVFEIQDDIVALSNIAQYVVVFCERSIWHKSYRNLAEEPVLISSSYGCSAPYSICKTEKGIVFYDGRGFSMTDGVNVQTVTAYKADNYLANMNNNLITNIRGVFNKVKRRLEYFFPFSTEATNNYGMEIGVDSNNVYPTERMDVNAAWVEEDSDSDLQVNHGSSSRLTDSATGDIWTHDEDKMTDGLPAGTDFYTTVLQDGSETDTGVVDSYSTKVITDSSESWTTNAFAGYTIRNDTDTSVANDTVVSNNGTTLTLTTGGSWEASDAFTLIQPRTLTVQGNTLNLDTTENEGVPAIVLTQSSNQDYLPFVIKKCTVYDNSASPKKYKIEYDNDFDLSDMIVNDIMLVGVIPWFYGIKWTDFSSPHSPHHVRELHIDLEPSRGYVYVDHYVDNIPTPVKTTSHYLTTTDTKIVSEFNHKKCYFYGYRIRGYSQQKIKITDISVLEDPV